ncbi:Uncharacterised protein [uncultured archaeon]|nr:Uncharacterised protein [uncultured archaeon]
MPKKRDLRLFLEEMLEEIQRIEGFVKGINKLDEFQKNEVVYYAVLKALENIGEAVRYIPQDIRDAYPLLWRKIVGLKDIISHSYFGIDAAIIWDVVKNKLPELKSIVGKILINLDEGK